MRYQEGNLFDAPKGSYLAHACNCVGRWGSGIALEFAKRFPKSYAEYREYCKEGAVPGEVFVCSPENGQQIVCLFTSRSYGKDVDSPKRIINATKCTFVRMPKDKPLHMPLINAGMFNVPWEHTAALLIQYDDLDITVWHLPKKS